MVNIYFKHYWILVAFPIALVGVSIINCLSEKLFLFSFSAEKLRFPNVCATALWERNARTVAGIQTNPFIPTPFNLNKPRDIYIGNNDTLYVLDTGYFRVQRFLTNSTIGSTIINGRNGIQLNEFRFSNSSLAETYL